MDLQEIESQLVRLAFKKSEPFCYVCYVRVKKEVDGGARCLKCGSDDLARELPGEGLEWGTSWILPILLRDALTPVNTEEAFEESIRECYPETTTVGWLELDTVTVMKDQDPVSWGIALGEWLDNETSEEALLTFDNGDTYYAAHDVENYLEQEKVA